LFLFSWDIDVNEDETLAIKYALIESIDWNILTRVDQQMENALQQCQQDFIQYEDFFHNIIKEVNIFILFSYILLIYFRFASYNMNILKNRLFVLKYSCLI
jgi:hypothetical protein